MNLSSLVRDNVGELLVKIVDFTETRQKILMENMLNIHRSDFVPKDLAVLEFCQSLNHAIVEHIQNQRLVLRDTDNVKFGANASLEAKPVVDQHANQLLEENREGYLKLQLTKLLENLLNRKIAEELLRQKQQQIVTAKERATPQGKHRQKKTRVFPMCSDEVQH